MRADGQDGGVLRPAPGEEPFGLASLREPRAQQLPDSLLAAWRAGPPVLYNPERDPYRVYLDTLDSAESRRGMRGCLDRVARLIRPDATTGAGQPWWLLRYEHTVRLRAMLREGTTQDGRGAYSPASVNKHLVAVRMLLRTCWRMGLMSAEDYQRAVDVEAIENFRLPHGHHVPDRVLAGALRACAADPSPAGRRDAAVLAVLFSTGIRRAEIAGLSLGDYDPAERSLRILGKGDKERIVYVTVETARWLDAWLAVRGRGRGALFPPVNKGGRCAARPDGSLRHPTGQAFVGILGKRLGQAGAPTHTPHDFRRTFIGELLDAGADLATVQQLVGHSSPDTTARYDRRPGRQRRAAVDKLRLPDIGGL